MLILTMDMDTALDTTACHTMAMVDNGATGLMEDGPTMARGLLMLSPLPRLMPIPTMDMDTTLVTMASLTMAMVETTEETTEDTGGGKITNCFFIDDNLWEYDIAKGLYYLEFLPFISATFRAT